MSKKYTVNFYKGEYAERQKAANRDKAILYIEQHLNAGSETADYALCVVGSNASRTSREFGQTYARKVAEVFGCKTGGANGILIGGYQGRGNANVKYANCPSVLLEPLFCSNPKRADQLRSAAGKTKLARILVECIEHFFPGGGTVAFSVGHKYKTSKPRDRGAAVHGGGTEADISEEILLLAEKMLTEEKEQPCELPENASVIYEVQKGDTLFSIARKFSAKVADIKRRNNLTSDTINVGQKLVVKD